MTELALPTYQSGQLSTVQRWLSTLGDSAAKEYPPLAVMAGGIAVLTGQRPTGHPSVRSEDHAISVLAFAAAARLAVHHGHRNEADRQIARACAPDRPARLPSPISQCAYAYNWPRPYANLADHPTARHLLREIDDILLHRPALGALVDEISKFRGILTSSRTHAGTPGVTPFSPAELRLLPYLQTHLTFRQIGERPFVSRRTVSSEVGSIYRKLGVSSRRDAVECATTAGLLGE